MFFLRLLKINIGKKEDGCGYFILISISRPIDGGFKEHADWEMKMVCILIVFPFKQEQKPTDIWDA